MEILLQSILSEWEAFLRAAPRLVLAVVMFLLVLLVGKLAGRGLSLILARAEFSESHRTFFRKVVFWIFAFIGFSLALNVVGLQGVAAGLLTGGGVTAVVLGFAFREIGENFLAGFFLAFSRPFRQGDLIQSGDLQGVVTGIEIRSTRIRTADGRDIFIPSSLLFKNPLINFTLDGLRRLEFKIGIDYRNDPVQACSLLLEAVKQDKGILKDPPPFAGISDLAAPHVELTVTFWLDAFKLSADIRTIRSRLMDRCRKALLDAGYTVSSEVSTNIDVRASADIPVAVNQV